MKKTIIASVLTMITLFSGGVSALDAPAALVPAGLNPGDTFYIIFVGSNTIDGAQTSATYINYANTVKANDPSTNVINGWTTLFGHDDTTLTILTAFTATDRPIYNTNGDKVADNRADLYDGTLDNAIGYDEQSNAVAGGVWTGFNENGTSAFPGDDTVGGADGLNDGCRAGSSNTTTLNWARNSLSGGAGCTGVNFPLYVLSPLLTVTGPPAGSSLEADW